MTHSPTPYSLMYEVEGENQTDVFLCAQEKKQKIALGSIFDSKDAQFIVKACNLHDELVAALEGMVSVYKSATGINNDVFINLSESVLQKAKS